MNPTITNYEQAAMYLGKKAERPLHGRATRLVRLDDTLIGVKFHDTFVVIYQNDGKTVLNSGGWRTDTTKDRINEYTPNNFVVTSSRGIWSWRLFGFGDERRGPWSDAFVLDAEGYPVVKDDGRPKIGRRAVVRYAGKLAYALISGALPSPLNPDACQLCKHNKRPEHLRIHLHFGALSGTLVAAALQEHGPVGFSLLDADLFSCWTRGDLRYRSYVNDLLDKTILKHTRRRVRNAIVRYFSRRFDFTEEGTR